MAYNEISLPKWQDLVRRRFGLTGPGGNVPVLASEIQPVAVVEPSLFEHEVLRGVVHFHYQSWVVSAADGDNVAIELRNPIGSGKIVVCDLVTAWTRTHEVAAGDIQTWPTGNMSIGVNDHNTNPVVFDSGPGLARPRDMRRFDRVSTGQWWSTSQPGAFGFSFLYGMMFQYPVYVGQSAAMPPLDIHIVAPGDASQYLLLPGWGLSVQAEADATGTLQLGGGFHWHEFDLEVAEQNA